MTDINESKDTEKLFKPIHKAIGEVVRKGHDEKYVYYIIFMIAGNYLSNSLTKKDFKRLVKGMQDKVKFKD